MKRALRRLRLENMEKNIQDAGWFSISGRKEVDSWGVPSAKQSVDSVQQFDSRPGDIFRAFEATNQVRLLNSALQQRSDKRS